MIPLRCLVWALTRPRELESSSEPRLRRREHEQLGDTSLVHLPRLTSLSLSVSLSVSLSSPSLIPLYRGCRSVGTSRVRLFSIRRQLQRVTGGPAIGGGGRHRWFNSHVTLSAWQRRRGASGEGFIHTDTHTHTYIHIHTQIESSTYTVTHVCVESFHTRFSHLHCGRWHDTLVHRHSSRVQRQLRFHEEHKGSRPPPPPPHPTTSTTTYRGDHVGYHTHKQTRKHFAERTRVFPLTNLLLSWWRRHRNNI